MLKPNKPIKPEWEDFPTPTISNAENYLGELLFVKLDFIKALEKYNKDIQKYEQDLETYNQIKLIKLVKNSTEKYCLKNIKILKLW